jgi:chromosome partitioning protein
MSLLTYNALLFANDIVVPVGMDGMAIIGARQTLDGVREIRELWPERRLDLLAVLPTAVNINTHATRAALEAIADDPEMSEALYRPGIRQCIDVTYALTQQQTIWEYAPRSRAADDYTAFVRFVAGRTVRDGAPAGAVAVEKAETVV